GRAFFAGFHIGDLSFRALLVGDSMGIGWIEALFLIGPLGVVPVGLRLHEGLGAGRAEPVLRWASRLALPLGFGVALSYVWVPGLAAVACALWWAGLTVLVGIGGLVRLAEGRWRNLDDFSITFSLLYLPVAGIWLTAARYGGRFIGFEE